MFFMTADRQSLPPNRAAGRKAPNELAYSGSSHALKAAGLIFSGVALSLAGTFAIIDYSSSHSRALIAADIKTVSAEVRAINTRLDSQQAATDQRFNRVEQRLDKFDERFERIDERFESLESKFDLKLEHLETRFDSKLERLETKLDQKLDTVVELLLQLVSQKAEQPAGTGQPAAGRAR